MRMVDRIYEGAVEPAAWPGIVQDFAVFFRSPKALLFTNFVAAEDGGLNVMHGMSQRTLEAWNAQYIAHDKWTQAVIAKRLFYQGAAIIESDMVPDEEFVRSKIYRELLVHENIGRACAGIVFASSEGGVLPTSMSVYKGIAEPPYQPSDRETMRILVPHLSRALGVMYRLRDAELKRVASLDALDRLCCGVVLLDATGIVQHASRPALDMVRAADGLELRGVDGCGRLLATDAGAQSALAGAVLTTARGDLLGAAHFATSVAVPRERPGGRPYLLQLSRLPERNAFGAAGVIVFITDPEREIRLDTGAMRRLFGITNAEARLASRLCGGENLASASASCQVASATAKAQLASLYQKTNTHSQAQLVSRLHSLASAQL
jgi:DNA-binding CsgD family transcriptional regulator